MTSKLTCLEEVAYIYLKVLVGAGRFHAVTVIESQEYSCTPVMNILAFKSVYELLWSQTNATSVCKRYKSLDYIVSSDITDRIKWLTFVL